jgi:hypothetical protein
MPPPPQATGGRLVPSTPMVMGFTRALAGAGQALSHPYPRRAGQVDQPSPAWHPDGSGPQPVGRDYRVDQRRGEWHAAGSGARPSQPPQATGCWRAPGRHRWGRSAARPASGAPECRLCLPALPVGAGRAGHGRRDRRSWGASPRSRAGRRWVIKRTHAWATSTASCAGAPSGAGPWSGSGWRWPTPPSFVADWSAAPGPATAGRAAPAAVRDHLLAQPPTLEAKAAVLRS